ncbi:tripartite tricarboxylate transporter TctB family protein [Rhodobacterales bacterium HKCCE3408]|nr:tripartite tricarboxylate transporter TctB family protein [Rhodobacterales bacterium HKCCE3408]
MTRSRTFQDLFRRYRRPGDLVFASALFAFALFLVASIPSQTTWVDGVGLVAQPAFWPTVSVIALALFAGLHLFGALVSDRIPGRGAEVLAWARAAEFPVWFLAYVWIVPFLGYLPGSILFSCLLTLRLGYRGWRWMLVAALFAAAVVIVFKSLLQVRIPAGEIYSLLPPGDLRIFFMTRF